MKRNYRVKPNKASGVLGMVFGAVFIGIGLFVAIPVFGAFGILWTLAAVAITGYNAYIAFSGAGAYSIEMEDDAAAPGTGAPMDFEEKLQKLQRLYDQRLITQEEYETKRQEILKEL